MKRTIQSALMLIALWGALLTIALHQGWEMPYWLSHEARTSKRVTAAARLERDEATAIAPAQPTSEVEPAPAATAEDDAPALTFARHRVCKSAAPMLSTIALDGSGSEVLAVHCGDAVHLIALFADVPTRIAHVTLPPPNPQETFAATRIVGADINADGSRDLLVPLLAVNSYQQPTGRGVHVLLRDVSGAFRPVQRLMAGSPLQLLSGRYDGAPGDDIVMLQATDQSVRKPREAWWISGGNAPKRNLISRLSIGSEQLASADLDRDGHLDVIALSPGEQRVDVLFNHGDGVEPALQLSTPGCDTLTVADVNGDAHDDVLCTGQSNHVITARSDRELTVTAMSFAGERVGSLHRVDVNADGKLDLIGYAHPQLVRLQQGDALSFEPRLIAELQGVSFAPITVYLSNFDHDHDIDAVMLGRAPGDDTSVDLVVIRSIHEHAVIQVQVEARALNDAPLLLKPAIP